MATGYYNVSKQAAGAIVAATITSPPGASVQNFDGAYGLFFDMSISDKAPLYSVTLEAIGEITLLGTLSIKRTETDISAVGIFSNNDSSVYVMSVTVKKNEPNKLYVYKVVL